MTDNDKSCEHIDYDNSIVLIGPVGVGKSYVASELSRQTGIRHFPIDTFVNLGSQREIVRELNGPSLSREDRERLRFCLQLREQFPNVPNFKDLGYSPKLERYLHRHFGSTAVSLYRKQFEIALLQSACENARGPVIFDMGAGFAECNDEMYLFYLKRHPILATFLKMHCPRIKDMGFDQMKSIFKQFQNVVYLKLPDDNSKWSARASRNFRGFGTWDKQFTELATTIVSTEGLYENGKPTNEFNQEFMETLLTQIETARRDRI